MTDNWLEIPGEARIVSGSAVTNDARRAPTMQKNGLADDPGRVWACDGEYIWFRRKLSNEYSISRHEGFIRSGDYEYLGTQDDVEIYRLKAGKFKRQMVLGELDMYNTRRQAILSAVKHDWPQFLDIMSYIRDHYRSQYHEAFADMKYAEEFAIVVAQVAQRRGPSYDVMARECAGLLQKRQKNAGKVISLG